MDYFHLDYGLRAEAPDLVESVPALGKLKEACPAYIRKAEADQRQARRFAREEILPRFLAIDSACHKDPTHVDWDLWRKANREKLTLAFIPEKLGGLGCTSLGAFCLIEELAAACMGCTANILFNNFGLLGAMVECRTGILMKIIREMVDASRSEKAVFWAWAITEPSAGTDAEDAHAMATMKPSAHAEKVRGGYRLNGRKCFITNGSLADHVIATVCMDRSDPLASMATFVVPARADGFSVGKVERKCGQKASQTAELIFEDLFVPEENLWEPPGRGLRHTREILSTTRGFIGAAGLGIARSALERCIQFAAQKRINGHRLIDEPWVQIAIADMLKDVQTVRAACIHFAVAVDTHHVRKLYDALPVRLSLTCLPERFLLSDALLRLAGTPLFERVARDFKHKLITDERVERFVREGSAVKVAGTDLAMKVTSRVLDIVGIEGAAHRYGMEKCFRDAKVTQIYEGSNQANLLDLFHGEVGGHLAARP